MLTYTNYTCPTNKMSMAYPPPPPKEGRNTLLTCYHREVYLHGKACRNISEKTYKTSRNAGIFVVDVDCHDYESEI